jgi:hypothetical protein
MGDPRVTIGFNMFQCSNYRICMIWGFPVLGNLHVYNIIWYYYDTIVIYDNIFIYIYLGYIGLVRNVDECSIYYI